MVERKHTGRRLNETIVALLRELVALPDILFVMGKGPEAVMEGWVDLKGTRITVQKDWVAVESKPWHCHLHLTEVARVRFMEEPDPHDTRRQAFSIRFLREDGKPLLMIFFGRMYDDAGLVLNEKVSRFRALKETYKL